MDLAPADADTEERRVALNVIAEHAHAAVTMLNEGIYPSNEGRGYVARRILRRAARRGLVLGIRDPCVCKLTSVVVDLLHRQYPELDKSRDRIAMCAAKRETRFLQTLETGMAPFRRGGGAHAGRGEKTISGKDAFSLYDTFGFPLDMTRRRWRRNAVSRWTKRASRRRWSFK